VDLDVEVCACFAEGRVCRVWEYHFWFRDAAFAVCFVSCAQAGHEDGFGAAASGYAYGAFGRVEQ
jgi:hypothetical protein